MVQDSIFKTGFVLAFWVVSVPNYFSITTSVVAMVYFAAMLKINVVDKQYKGSWRLFFKSWYRRKKRG